MEDSHTWADRFAGDVAIYTWPTPTLLQNLELELFAPAVWSSDQQPQLHLGVDSPQGSGLVPLHKPRPLGRVPLSRPLKAAPSTGACSMGLLLWPQRAPSYGGRRGHGSPAGRASAKHQRQPWPCMEWAAGEAHGPVRSRAGRWGAAGGSTDLRPQRAEHHVGGTQRRSVTLVGGSCPCPLQVPGGRHLCGMEGCEGPALASPLPRPRSLASPQV